MTYEKQIEATRRAADGLTDIDLALADADALQILAAARNGNAAGFHIVTRVLTRIMKRVLTGDASICYIPKRGVNADLVLHALLMSYTREISIVRGVVRDLNPTDVRAHNRAAGS